MKASALRASPLKKRLLQLASLELVKRAKNIKTVSVGVHYTTKSEPDVRKGKEFTFDVDKTAEKVKTYATNVANIIKRKDDNYMPEYKYKVIWLNEMGEEQVAYTESKEERDTKMQALADDGYSPVWKDAK